jgi:hypothetical protein
MTLAYDAVNGPGILWRDGDEPGPRIVQAEMTDGQLTPGREYVLEAAFATSVEDEVPTHPFWGHLRLRIDGTESSWSPSVLGPFYTTLRHRFVAVNPEPVIEIEIVDTLPEESDPLWRVFVTDVYIRERGY